jgi:hypothetical protein
MPGPVGFSYGFGRQHTNIGAGGGQIETAPANPTKTANINGTHMFNSRKNRTVNEVCKLTGTTCFECPCPTHCLLHEKKFGVNKVD